MKNATVPAVCEYSQCGYVKLAPMPVLPGNGIVNFQGQPIAAVVTDSKYDAADILELISVEYEPLEPVLSIDHALNGDIMIHDGFENNLCCDIKLFGGNVEEAFKVADLIIEDELEIHRVIPNPLETWG
jgi:CO/xanthine dehydrogenase Mo-binding subunit